MKILLFLAGLAAFVGGGISGLANIGENWNTPTDKPAHGCLVAVGGIIAMLGSIIWALL